MSLYSIKDTTLTAIGDAIREKNGSTDKYTSEQMADAILAISSGGGGGGEEIEPIVLTGTTGRALTGPIAAAFVEMYPDKISTVDLVNTTNLCDACRLKTIPFALNYSDASSTIGSTFINAQLESLPPIINAYAFNISSMFNGCTNLKRIEDSAIETWRWGSSGSWGSSIFTGCKSLRHIPSGLLKQLTNAQTSSYSSQYYNTFQNCMHLDEILELGVNTATLTSDIFKGTFTNCSGLKHLTFAMNEDGTPKTANWKAQIIDLSSNVGFYKIDYTWYKKEDYLYNSGTTADKIIYDDATYAALKGDSDAWVCGYSTENPHYYSFYNHDSAVETINSLPDCSASGGTNTIKFKGEAGLKTDAGAINTLTEEEIAVATAKGWTVTLV